MFKTKIVRGAGFVAEYRWPWRVKSDWAGLSGRFPWWGKPYRWLMNLMGIELLKIESER